MSGDPEVRDCAVCRSDRKKVLFRQRFAGGLHGALLSGYDVVVCTTCGFGFADGLPSQAAFDAYYNSMSKYEYQRQGGTESCFEEQRFPAAVGFIRGALPNLDARVLDVGCSNGGLLHALQNAGYSSLLGVDPSPTCAATARRLHGLHILIGTLSEPPQELGRYDLVLLSAVLEHVRDLADALRQVRRALVPDGLLYVEVPDVTRFGVTPDAPFQEFSVEHVNYFSSRSLRNLLASAGFEEAEAQTVTTVQGENTVADVIMAVFRARDGWAGGPIERDVDTESALTAYIAESGRMEAGIHAMITRWVESEQEIIVWGVGTHTQRLLAESPLGSARIVAFVDSNPRYQGKHLAGVPIIPPSALPGRREPILISSRFYQREIERQIREELRLKNEIILLYRF